jgi:hypothetical protein
MPGEATLTPGSPRGPGFSPPREDASDDKISVPGSFDIVDLGTGELGLPGYLERRFCLPAGGKWWVCGVDVFADCDCVPTAEGDVGHVHSGCSATSPG